MSIGYLGRDVKTFKLLTPQTITETTASSVLDTRGGRGAFLVSIGDSGDTLSSSLYLEVELQDCATSDGDFAAVADSEIVVFKEGVKQSIPTGTALTGTAAVINAPTEDQITLLVQYTGPERYAKISIRATGSHSTGTPVCVEGLLFDVDVLPVS